MIKEYDAKGNPKLYSYDLAGRLVKVTSREGNETKFEFNHYGEKIKTIDGLGNPTSYEYDSAGRLTKVIDANGLKTVYTYDLSGNKLYMTDGRGKTPTYVYGALAKLRSVKDADGGVTRYQYDLEDNVVYMTDRNGYHTNYVYDSRKLLLKKNVKETADSVTYRYDEVGNRTGMTDESGNTIYTYDANNRLAEIRKSGKPQINYLYDQIGNIIKVTDAAGNVTAYTYDKASRMETVTFDGGKLTYHYDENGNRLSIAYGNGVTERYEYNKNNEVISLINKKPGGGEISRYSYTYDAAGRQVTKTDSYGTTNYTYDKAGRILKVEGPGKIDIYAYDGAGNRIAVNETYKSLQPSGFIDDASGKEVQYILKKTDYTYSNAGKLLKLLERMYDGSNKEVLRKTVNYYYDSNGNELSHTASWTHPHNIKLRQSTKGSLYADNMENEIDPLINRVNNTFDGFGRLVKVENISGGVRTVSAYLYNGDNLRVSKTVQKSSNGYQEEVTNYLYDRQNVILATEENNKVSTRYVKGINYVASVSDGNKVSYFLFNGHGDVVQTIDNTGEVQNHYDYDIWGNPTLTVEITECAIRYAGEFYDSETGLYYLRARYYDPSIGRFLSEDSYWGEDENPLSLNRYTYAHNDPIQYLDPTGYVVIKKGAQGDGVVAIQEMLKGLGYNTGKIDGKFGSNTEAAIKKFQKDNGLKVDGIVGNQSLTALKTMNSVKNAPESEKAWAKESVANAKTGDIKSDTMLMSTKTFDKALDNITALRKQTNGGSVQTEIKNNTLVITGVTVKNENSQDTEIKAAPGREIRADSNMDVAVFSGTVASEAKSQEKQKKSPTAEAKTPSSKSSTPTKETISPIFYPYVKESNFQVKEYSDNDYLTRTWNQVIFGNYSEDVTWAGTGIQIFTGIIGIDLPADMRDLSADFVNWEWSWDHVGRTALDTVAFIPIVGGFKYADEAGTLLKHGDEVGDAVKGASKTLTSYDDVASYISKNGNLPDNFITKNEAKALGWNPKSGNLAEVAPGKSIGGDVFRNTEGKLPSTPGRTWYETDINYSSGYRGDERILYSNDGLIYKTTDHYNVFTQIK